jgi:hypothetical protein
LIDVLESPAYATSVGLLLWGMRHSRAGEPPSRPPRPPSALLGRIRNWFRAFLPG